MIGSQLGADQLKVSPSPVLHILVSLLLFSSSPLTHASHLQDSRLPVGLDDPPSCERASLRRP
jgi:hypothetical protein